MLRSKLLAGVVLLGFALTGDPAAAAPESCRFGVNAHQVPDAALDLAAAAGIGWVRFDLNWWQFEPKKGQYAWAVADGFIDHAVSLGLHVFITVAYSPSWAVQQPCNDNDPEPKNQCHNRPPLSVGDWTDFLKAAVGRYQDHVKHWGMWNEPNLAGFFAGTRDQYVSLLLKPGSDAVHAVCPGCKVLGPELANLRGANWDAKEGTCVAGECIFNGWNYSLNKVLEAAGGYIDIVTHHKYGDPASKWWKEAVDGETVIIKILEGIKEVTDKHVPGKPVWITEVGWESESFGDNTNAYAATQLEALYQGLAQIQQGTFPGATNQPWPELEKVFWYDLVDDPNGYSWGLLESGLKPKDPYDSYQKVIGLLGGCAGGGGSGGSGGTGGAGGAGTGGEAGGGPQGGQGGTGADAPGGGGPSSASSGTASSSSGSGGAGAAVGADDDNGGLSGCACRLGERSPGSSRWLLAGLLVSLWHARRRARRG
jgi:hypothetical protein